MLEPGRNYSVANTNYRYGFNGQEKSDEIISNTTTAEYWEYDSRIGRRWNPDPVVNISESQFSCFGNNPVYYSDPSGDFKTKFGARWYKFWHNEKGEIGQSKSGIHADEWYISRTALPGKQGDGKHLLNEVVISTPIYGPQKPGFADNTANWWNSVEWTSQTNIEVTIGVQAGANIRINSLINAKVEGGLLQHTLFDFKADAMHMERTKINYGFEIEEGNYYLQKNYLNIGIEAGIPKTALTANIGYDYIQTQKYYHGYYGSVVVDAETSKGWNGNLKLNPFKSKETQPVLTNNPSAKIGINTEKKFYGLDVSAAAKLIFGVKVQFKIGFQKK